MNVTVRQTTREDRDEVIRLMKGYLDFYKVEHPADSKLHDLLDTLEAAPERGLQFIAEVDGTAVGFATLYSTFSTLRAQKAMVMNDLFVDPSQRSTGVGHALFQACKAYVQENGYAFMSWETAHDNETAQRFYDREGGQRGNWVSYSI
ncbi:MAG: N-acetyltransferase family protein [Tumebacillaceae bacterium]